LLLQPCLEHSAQPPVPAVRESDAVLGRPTGLDTQIVSVVVDCKQLHIDWESGIVRQFAPQTLPHQLFERDRVASVLDLSGAPFG
jgi:hypothetical protein